MWRDEKISGMHQDVTIGEMYVCAGMPARKQSRDES